MIIFFLFLTGHERYLYILCINQLTRFMRFTMFGEVSVSEGDWVNVLKSQATANYMHYKKDKSV